MDAVTHVRGVGGGRLCGATTGESISLEHFRLSRDRFLSRDANDRDHVACLPNPLCLSCLGAANLQAGDYVEPCRQP